ncbi:MAG TPA: hypothetical protein VIY48_04230 [Candidatus Paceibacterota bacterium]
MSKPKIKYHVSAEREKQMMASEEDDPMSASFIPLTERSETDKARWWANHAKAKRLRRNFAEFD